MVSEVAICRAARYAERRQSLDDYVDDSERTTGSGASQRVEPLPNFDSAHLSLPSLSPLPSSSPALSPCISPVEPDDTLPP
jgi:hypothetical protein